MWAGQFSQPAQLADHGAASRHDSGEDFCCASQRDLPLPDRSERDVSAARRHRNELIRANESDNAMKPLATILMSCLIMLSTSVSADENYPRQPVRIVVPFQAGSVPDVEARYLATHLSNRLNQPVVIDNKPGGNAVLGTRVALAAPPDGYTVLFVGNSGFVQPLTVKDLSYSMNKDFTPIAVTLFSEQMLVVRKESPFNSLADLIADARANPGKLTFGSGGVGSVGHIAGAAFSKAAGVSLVHVPYRGAPDSVRAVIAGEIDMSVAVAATVAPMFSSERIKVLAHTGPKRTPLYPDIPTLEEAMPNGFTFEVWTGLMVRTSTPQPIVDRLRAELAKILALPETEVFYAKQYAQPRPLPASRLESMFKSEEEKILTFAKDLQLKAE